jgi:hypothetical protein
MRGITWAATVAVALVCCAPAEVQADGVIVKHRAKVVVQQPVCVHGCVVRRPVCPDPYSCYSLYGAYGPYGGYAYWTRFTGAGWYR